MIKRLLSLSRYHAVVVFLLAGLFAVAFAFLVANLFQMATANLAFLRNYGLRAVMEGGLLQLLGLMFNGVLSLTCFLGFKICETDLTRRYWRWIGG